MNRLKEILEYQKLTQTYIAWKFGVSQATVSRWVSGERSPTIKTGIKLAELLHTTVEYIWGE